MAKPRDLLSALERLANTIIVWASTDATPYERAAWDFLLAERDRLRDEAENAMVARIKARDALYLAELAAAKVMV